MEETRNHVTQFMSMSIKKKKQYFQVIKSLIDLFHRILWLFKMILRKS